MQLYAEQTRNYKPLTTRTPFLALFALLTLLLTALIETAFRTLPKAVGPGLISTTLNTTQSSIGDSLQQRRGPPSDCGKSSKDPCAYGDPPKWCYLMGCLLQPREVVPTVISESMTVGGVAIQISSVTPSSLSGTAPPYRPRNLFPSLTIPPPSLKPRAHNTAASGIHHMIPHREDDPSHSIRNHSYQYWTITKGLYFVASYLPVLIAVVISGLWSIVDTSIKGMEPFYQLANPTGVTGERSLAMKFRTSGIGRATYHALSYRHWVVLLSSVISFLLTLIVPLSSEMIFINTKATCTPVPPHLTHCLGKLQVSKTIARVVEFLLACTAVLCAGLAGMMWGRRSGVYADPSSIAGLATLLQNKYMLEELRQLDPQISDNELARTLANKRFRIGHFRNPDGVDGYGFTSYKPGIGVHDTKKLDRSISKTSSASARQKPDAKRSLWLHPVSVVAFALTLVGILTLVAYYHLRGEDTGFEKFMDSQGFGVSFLMTAMGVLVKTYWANIEEEIRTLEPYRNLSLRPSPARDTILVTSKSTPITALPSSLISLRPFLALMAFNTILAETLTVALPGVPYKDESILIACRSSAILTVTIIAFMLATLVWVAVRGTWVLALPRRPDTIAALLLYLCAGKAVGDLQGLAMVEGRARDEAVVNMRKKYWLGKVVGIDGVERVGIEAEDEVQG